MVGSGIFDKGVIDKDIQKKLGIGDRVKRVVVSNNEKRILEIFRLGGDKGLSTRDIVVAWYNLYTKPLGEVLKNRDCIAMSIHRLIKKGKLGIVKRGIYRVV